MGGNVCDICVTQHGQLSAGICFFSVRLIRDKLRRLTGGKGVGQVVNSKGRGQLYLLHVNAVKQDIQPSTSTKDSIRTHSSTDQIEKKTCPYSHQFATVQTVWLGPLQQ